MHECRPPCRGSEVHGKTDLFHFLGKCLTMTYCLLLEHIGGVPIIYHQNNYDGRVSNDRCSAYAKFLKLNEPFV